MSIIHPESQEPSDAFRDAYRALLDEGLLALDDLELIRDISAHLKPEAAN